MFKKLLCILLATMLLLGLMSLGLGAAAESAIDAQPDGEAADEYDSGDPDDGWLYADDEDGLEHDEDDEDDGAEWLQDVADDGEEVVDSLGDPEEDDLLGAMDVFSWFAMRPLDVDESLPDPTGTMWRVLDERFNTKEGMLDMLRFYFSDAIVNELWNSNANPYKEIDGYLYTTGEGREMDDNIGETEFTIVSRTDTRVEIDVDVLYIEPEGDDTGDSQDTLHYVRELINGEWKYTQFPFFW